MNKVNYTRIEIHGALFGYEAIVVDGLPRLAFLPDNGVATAYYLLPNGKYRRAKRRVRNVLANKECNA